MFEEFFFKLVIIFQRPWYFRSPLRAPEIEQYVKTLVTKPHVPSLVPRSNLVEAEKRRSRVAL